MSLLNKVKGIKPISEGSSIPAGLALKENDPHTGTVKLDTLSGKNLIIGVPGAFTPPCSSHVPGYVTDADKFVEKGIKGIYIVAVNDTFTTQAWKEKLKSDSPLVHFLADDTGDFTAAAGMSFDATGLLGNTRSQRYVAVVEDAVVKQFFIEDEAPNVEKTKADNVLAALK